MRKRKRGKTESKIAGEETRDATRWHEFLFKKEERTLTEARPANLRVSRKWEEIRVEVSR